MADYSILVNTCDKFDDCWDPFFKLFKVYWPDYNGKIYLNTEYKDYSYPGLDIVPLKICKEKQDAHLITWSECLKRALELIDTDTILYLQEDYFIKSSVSNRTIKYYSELMNENDDIHCIHLTDQSVISNSQPTKYNGLFRAVLRQRYLISMQAALWQKKVLENYIRPHENAWQFEEFGSKRGRILKNKFYVIDKSIIKLNEFEILPYIFTGIIQGRWFEEVIPLFEKHNIEIDYSIRGFTLDRPNKGFLMKLKTALSRLPIYIKSNLEVYGLKFKYLLIQAGDFNRKILYFLRGKVVYLTRDYKIYYLLYKSFWHSVFIRSVKDEKSDLNYYSAVPHRGAGIGHQIANWIAGYHFSKEFQLKFAHISFPDKKWEQFLGFSQDEDTFNNLVEKKGYQKVTLPLFDEYQIKEKRKIQQIIKSYNNKKVIFVAEQDQYFRDQYIETKIVKQKFHNCKERKIKKLNWDEDAFNIAVHIRRGDIKAIGNTKNKNLSNRWLDNSYYEKVLGTILKNLTTSKIINIYLFSQGNIESFKSFEKFGNVHFFLNISVMNSFLYMAYSDLLITSKSSFSYKPGLISNGIKIAPKDFWHGYPMNENWILADDKGKFDIQTLKDLLSRISTKIDKV